MKSLILKSFLFLLPFQVFSFQETYSIEASINETIKESSGIEIVNNIIWTLEDAGNKAMLFGLDFNGNIVHEIKITNSKNEDWEDIAYDSGFLYIGDIGNNKGKRREIQIYKIKTPKGNMKSVKAEKIEIELPKKIYKKDTEAFFVNENYFFFFTKENGRFYYYKANISNRKSKAKLLGSYNFDSKNESITAADISNDGSKIALLNHDKVWILSNFKDDDFFGGTIKKIKFNNDTQKEGICFLNNKTLYITDENSGKNTGKIYRLKLK